MKRIAVKKAPRHKQTAAKINANGRILLWVLWQRLFIRNKIRERIFCSGRFHEKKIIRNFSISAFIRVSTLVYRVCLFILFRNFNRISTNIFVCVGVQCMVHVTVFIRENNVHTYYIYVYCYGFSSLLSGEQPPDC